MKLTLAGIAAVATAIVGVASANAGTFAVNIDAWGNGAGCNLFAVWGSVNEFSWDTPCNGYPMSVGGPNNGSVPAGTRVGYQTSAPAGIAIVGANVVANTILNLNDGRGGAVAATGRAGVMSGSAGRPAKTMGRSPVAIGGSQWSAGGRRARTTRRSHSARSS